MREFDSLPPPIPLALRVLVRRICFAALTPAGQPLAGYLRYAPIVSLRSALGFILTTAQLIGIVPASLAKFQDRVREKWDARQSLSSEQLRDGWNAYVRGW